MVSPVSPHASLEPLSQAFRRYLQETNLDPRLTTLVCQNSQGRLLVLARHPAPPLEDPAGLLRELKTVFFEIMPEVGLPEEGWASLEEIPVRLGLQVETETVPYATHTFTWRIEDALGVIFEPPCPEEWTEAAQDSSLPPVVPDNPDLPPPPSSTAAAIEDPEPAATSSALVPFNDATLAIPETAVEPPAESRVQRWGQWSLGRMKQLAPYWSYGLAGLILLSSGLFAYTLTRPCVVGSCDRMAQAAAFQTAARDRVASDPTLEALQESRSELQAAIDLLSPIPPWSPQAQAAQANLTLYRTDLRGLDALIEAQGKAFAAAQKSQHPPHPVEHWTTVYHLWQQALTALKAVPATSPVHSHAQAKLAEYKANAAAIEHRITAEEETEANLNSALQAGQLAQQRMATAASLPGWQLAEREWQAAIHGLLLIPQGTQVYPEAQQHLQAYRLQLSQVQARVNQEGSATSSYQQARIAASQAAAYEAKNQWTQAVAQWKIALANAQQIAAGSTLTDEAKALVPTYRAALARAQVQLRTAVALQALQTQLGSLCRASATPCRIEASPEQIQITLASQYAQALEQAITPPADSSAAAVPLSDEAQALVEQIVLLSNQVQRPVEIYDAHGGFIARYRPDLGGFVRD